MALTVKALQGDIAAEVGGVDIAAGITPEIANEIETVLSKYIVIVLRNQQINDEQQQAFIQHFGPPVKTNAIKELEEATHRQPHLLDIATVDAQGKPLADKSFIKLYMLANQFWHTDGSQSQPPQRLTALSARRLPTVPPNTEYADMRAAWDTLPALMQEKVEDLKAQHSIAYSRAKMGLSQDTFSAESLKNRPPVEHALVRKHPRSGRKSLYLSGHASHIVGWPEEEGRALLDELMAHAVQRQFVYAHQWQPNDLVMWDDSCSMHRALPYDAPEPRVLRWSGVRELQPV